MTKSKVVPIRVTEINPGMLELFKEEVLDTLTRVASDYGVSLKFQGGSYSPVVATLKLEVAVIGATGVATSKEAEDFKQACSYYGFKPSDLGKKIVTPNGTYKIVGLLPRSKKYPILCERSDGKRFKLKFGTVLKALGRSE